MQESRFKRFDVLNRVLVCLTLAVSCVALSTRGAQAKMNVGTNLNGVNYFTTERPFIDAMKMSSSWKTSYNGGAFDTAQISSIPLDSNGWPLSLPVNVSGNNVHVHSLVPAYANGTYTIKTVGKGNFEVKTGSTTTTFAPNGGNNTYSFNVSNANLGRGEPNYIYLKITQSQSGDNLRNVQILLPGYGSSTETFYPTFKSRLGIYSAIRFMDWGNTNWSTITSWNQRTRPTSYTQGADYGVSYEHMIQLCNELGKDMWVCVPQAANNDYVTQLASLIRDNLNPARKVYIEYSNEIWNGQFSAGVWLNNNVSGTSTLNRQGVRTRQVFDLFTSAFGGNSRLVRVIAGQAANADTLVQVYDGAGGVCDAFAIAPYFGKTIVPGDISAGIPSLDTLIGQETWNRTATVNGWLSSSKSVANERGKRLICYEGGQHYVGIQGAENDLALTNQLIALNRDYRMRDYYRNTYLPAVNAGGVDLFMSFSSVGEQSKYGSWGVLEYMDQTVSPNNGDAVKYWAIQDWINNAPGGTPTPTPTPTPGAGTKYEAETASLSGGASVATDHTGYSGNGFVAGYWTSGATTTFTVNVSSAGSYNVTLRYANGNSAVRTLSVFVNGVKIRQTSLNATSNWDTWGDKIEALNLNSGNNTIAYKYDTGDSGNANLDYIFVGSGSVGTPTPTATPTPAPSGGPKYEAESATRSGSASIATDHTGYSGSGFVAGYGTTGATTTFTVSANTTGSYGVNLRYANGTGAARTVSIYVNGVKIRQTSLPSLANWDTWGDKIEALNLNSGSNTIAYKYDSGDTGNVNLDYIYCDAAGGAGGGTPTGVNLVTNASFDAETSDTQTPSSWSESGTVGANYTEGIGRTGTRHGTHWTSGAYTVSNSQTKTGLTNGLYTLRAWVQSGGGQTTARMEAKNFGGTQLNANIGASSSWVQVQLTGINVTNGSCTYGFYSDAPAGKWLYFDDVEFFKQ